MVTHSIRTACNGTRVAVAERVPPTGQHLATKAIGRLLRLPCGREVLTPQQLLTPSSKVGDLGGRRGDTGR